MLDVGVTAMRLWVVLAPVEWRMYTKRKTIN